MKKINVTFVELLLATGSILDLSCTQYGKLFEEVGTSQLVWKWRLREAKWTGPWGFTQDQTLRLEAQALSPVPQPVCMLHPVLEAGITVEGGYSSISHGEKK